MGTGNTPFGSTVRGRRLSPGTVVEADLGRDTQPEGSVIGREGGRDPLPERERGRLSV